MTPRRRLSLPRATDAELALAPTASMVSFGRPTWMVAAAIAALPYILVGWRTLLHRIRARWDEHDLVIETWPRRCGRRVARADVVEIRRDADALIVLLASGDALPLVAARRARRQDVERARELAYGLGVPFVDEDGELLTLPPARVR